MMDENTYNPFASSGKLVYGEQFVGRQEAIWAIQQKVLNPPGGCLAIVGSPRIGKSSLAYHVLIHPQLSLIQKKILTLWISLEDIETHEELFRQIGNQTLEALKNADSQYEVFLLEGQDFLNHDLPWIVLKAQVYKLFKRVKQVGWRVIGVIDEFDKARQIFKDGAGFEALRKLAYEPQYGVTIVTISRRKLPEITKQCTKDVSNFDNIFQTEYLRCFSKDELEKLLDRLKIIGLEVNRNISEFIWDNTGGHPYLASLLAFELSKSWLYNHQYNLQQAITNSVSEFLNYYNKLFVLLKEDGSFDKVLLQALFGPVTKETILKAEELERYGLIKKVDNGYYIAFSLHFEDYLRGVSRTIDLWYLWDETERKLRTCIDQIIEKNYQTSDWISIVEKSQVKLKQEVFDKCRKLQRREQKRFGSRALVSLLDFTNMDDLWKIISQHWSLFEPILGKDKDYWHLRLQFLSTVRNPMASNRSNKVLAPYELQKADEYCKEIIALLSKQSAFTESETSKRSSNSNVTIHHYGDNHYGGNMPENKPTYDLRGAKFGGGFASRDQTGGTLNDYSVTSEPKQTLAEAAQEIQQLLKQLAETNPDATEAEQKAFVTAVIPPIRRERFFNALKAAGKAAIEEILDNPYVNVVVATIEGWQENI